MITSGSCQSWLKILYTLGLGFLLILGLPWLPNSGPKNCIRPAIKQKLPIHQCICMYRQTHHESIESPNTVFISVANKNSYHCYHFAIHLSSGKPSLCYSLANDVKGQSISLLSIISIILVNSVNTSNNSKNEFQINSFALLQRLSCRHSKVIHHYS